MEDFEDFFPNDVKTEEDCMAAIKDRVFALEIARGFSRGRKFFSLSLRFFWWEGGIKE